MSQKQRIFDEYAKSQGYADWESIIFEFEIHLSNADELNLHIFAACDLVQEDQQKRIAEKALVKFDYIGLNKTGATMSQKYFAGPGMRQYTADKDSIINPENKIQ